MKRLFLGRACFGLVKETSRVQRTEISALPAPEQTLCHACKDSGRCPKCNGTGADPDNTGNDCGACEGDGRCPECPG